MTVIHPREEASSGVTFAGRQRLWERVNSARTWLRNRLVRPKIKWHVIDPRVEMRFVPTLDEIHIPDAEVIFGTAWQTARKVLEYSPSKGQQCYLIQHYETWMGDKELRGCDLAVKFANKVVVSKWLYSVGKELGCDDLTHISNGIDLNHYRLVEPLARNPRVAMLYSKVPFKGAADGIRALENRPSEASRI